MMLVSTTKVGAMDLAGKNSQVLRGWFQGVKASGAFTLIELLVVIAIIAILAAILMPVLDKAKKRALTAQCLNNMKELQICYRMYVDDNNDFLPLNATGGLLNGIPSWITNNDAQTTVIFDGTRNGVLYQYNQNVKLYACPANPRLLHPPNGTQAFTARTEYGSPGITTGSLLPQPRTCSIGFSLGGYNGSSSTAGGPVLLSTGVYAVNKYNQMITPNPTPTGMIVFCDENDYSVDDGDFAMYPTGSQNVWWNMPGSRHNRGTTWSFADGHCEYWKWHGTVVPFWDNNPNYTSMQPADTSDDLARVQACTSPLP